MSSSCCSDTVAVGKNDNVQLHTGSQEQGEAYLLPTLRLHVHRCRIINQPIQAAISLCMIYFVQCEA